MLHGGEPVRDDEHRAMRHQTVDRLLHQPLGLGVERAGGLIENEDRGIAEQRPCNRDSLALATGEPRAALAQQRAIALGEAHDELVRVGRARRGTHLVERHILQAVGDIREHAVVEEHRFLRHDPHEPPQGRACEIRERHAVHEDLAARRLVEARQEIDERRLPSPRRTHDGDHLAALYFEIDIA